MIRSLGQSDGDHFYLGTLTKVIWAWKSPAHNNDPSALISDKYHSIPCISMQKKCGVGSNDHSLVDLAQIKCIFLRRI